jgi:hypothetical protein
MQRANAYLDHYYMVMGKAGIFGGNTITGLPEFRKVSYPEECKLLPSPGIYAVSVETGGCSSKGMALITGKEQVPSEVLLDIFDQNISDTGASITSYFHKKIHGAVSLADPGSLRRIISAREEIQELIY